MGAVGPTQVIVTVNGRLRSFSKTTGLADGALNVDPNVFFNSVRSTNTSDPRIRYDRLSGRWFITMIDINGGNNRILLAVSSGSTIASASSFTFFDVPSDTTSPARATSDFADYDTLGIDTNALYIGTNVFSSTGAFKGTDGYVIRKSSVLGQGPIVVTVFRDLAVGTGEGPFTPQGVDNFDPQPPKATFIGVEQRALRRAGAAPRLRSGRHAEHLVEHPHHGAVDRLPAGRAADRQLRSTSRHAGRPAVRRPPSGTGSCGRHTTSG